MKGRKYVNISQSPSSSKLYVLRRKIFETQLNNPWMDGKGAKEKKVIDFVYMIRRKKEGGNIFMH